jgi:hypothetical protein
MSFACGSSSGSRIFAMLPTFFYDAADIDDIHRNIWTAGIIAVQARKFVCRLRAIVNHGRNNVNLPTYGQIIYERSTCWQVALRQQGGKFFFVESFLRLRFVWHLHKTSSFRRISPIFRGFQYTLIAATAV